MVPSPECRMPGVRWACQSPENIVWTVLRMNDRRNLREIERLGWGITASVSLQFEFLDILFSPFCHLREEFQSRRTDVPARPLTLLAGSTAHSSGWRLRADGLEHHAP